jgi:hypothetical protein
MSTFTETVSNKPFVELLPLVNENKKTTLLLIPRVDRLGTNLINYVSQINHAYNNNWFIKYDPNVSYNNSIFVKCLMEYIDFYNETLDRTYFGKIIEETEEIKICKEHDINYTTALTVVHLQCDLITYFKKYIYENVRYNLDQHTMNLGYQVPFDPKKTILVHLRLEDVRTWPHYDGRFCCGHYADRINRGEECEYTSFGWHHNRQTPMPVDIVQRQIDAALVKYPEHEVIIITSPGDYGTGFSYRDIRSNDENYDLFLLCNSEVVILSRSNFSLCALFYGIVQEAYVPMWGHLSCLGPCTKYDNCKFNYYF